MQDVFAETLRLLENGEPVALATVVSGKGSLPMSRKAKMLVRANGEIAGTVGGGAVEAEVCREGQRVVASGEGVLRKFVLTETQAGGDGLTCGGTVEILVEALTPGPVCEVLREINSVRRRRGSAVLGTLVSQGESAAGPGKCLVQLDGTVHGTLGIPQVDEAVRSVVPGDATVPEDLARVVRLQVEGQGEAAVFVESLCPEPTLYLFGGGHISLAVAQIAAGVGFRIVVVDDRPEFANRDRFPVAQETLVREMDRAFEDLEIDDLSYIVSVTRGHSHDREVIRSAVHTQAAYIGMIGSRRKITALWGDLEADGVPRDLLDRVHAPIGLDIGADTPEEIAVSIVAELIHARRRKGAEGVGSLRDTSRVTGA